MQKRILEISKKFNLSHIGSSLGVYQVLQEIDKVKKPEDIIVLDEAHGALGYYVYLEEHGIADAELLFNKHGVHQNRDMENKIYVSGGSLGLAGSVSLGMAVADRQRDVFVILSDGGFREGIWVESLRIARDLKVTNWKLYMNFNGFSGYGETNYGQIKKEIEGIGFPVNIIKTDYAQQIPLLSGLKAHYITLDEKTYAKAIRQLKTWENKRNKTPKS